jgi:hypothetical protein
MSLESLEEALSLRGQIDALESRLALLLGPGKAAKRLTG